MSDTEHTTWSIGVGVSEAGMDAAGTIGFSDWDIAGCVDWEIEDETNVSEMWQRVG